MEVGLVRRVDIDQEMQQSYLDFAMSVIVARALPDARDGLKPVQRRILYAMYDMGLRSNSDFKKSARIVGEVLGKYHPHGDSAVYEAMARQAQDFSMRYQLVDGQGNFGSVDGDPPAAMRYTEARLKSFAIDMLSQIERDTVDFAPNFDGSLNEPLVLPAALPNLLVNGSTGIAVGMATNIPPHNLSEVIDALVHMLKEWDRLDDINVSDLMKFIKGPDFPTGGIILQDETSDLLTAYGSGRGRIPVRGRVHMEDTGRGRSRLIITELPYMTNKSSLIERIAELVRDGDLDGISDLRDESDRQGMRIVIELRANAEPEDILRKLYKRTPLQSTIGITLLALVDNEPRLLSLKQALRVYLDHRQVVVRRRSEYDLERARQRAHLLEGLRIAISNLDEIIKLIRAATDVDQARDRLMKRFKLSQIQAQAILDMQLRRLAALERKKIEEEYKELIQQMKELEALLKSPKRMREVVQEELVLMKQQYGDRRRTQIVSFREGETAHMLLTATDLITAETTWVGVTQEGMIGRIRGGEAPKAGGQQSPRWMVRTNTHHTLYLVTAQGQAAAVAVHVVPEVDSLADAVPLHRVSSIPEGEMLAGMFSVPPRNGNPHSDHYVITASAQGLVKKSVVSELPGPSSQRFTLARVNQGDWLVGATLTDGNAEVLMLSARGMAIRFAESEVRAMGLVAAGVNGMKLGAGDQVVGFSRFNPDSDILLLATNGSAWRIPAKEFPLQGRYGMGVIASKPPTREAMVGMIIGKVGQTGLVHFEKLGSQMVRLDAIPAGKRQGTARPLAAVKSGDAVTALIRAGDGLEYWDPEAVLPGGKPTRKRAAAPSADGKGTAAKSKAAKPSAVVKGPAVKTSAGKAAAPAAGKTSAKASPVKMAEVTKTATAKPSAAKPAPGKAVTQAPGKQAAAPVKPAAVKKTSTTKEIGTAAPTQQTKAAASSPKGTAGAAKPEQPAASKSSSARAAKSVAPAAEKTGTKPAAPRARATTAGTDAESKTKAKPVTGKASTAATAPLLPIGPAADRMPPPTTKRLRKPVEPVEAPKPRASGKASNNPKATEVPLPLFSDEEIKKPRKKKGLNE